MRPEGAKTGFLKPRKAAEGDGAIETSDWTPENSGLLNSLLEGWLVGADGTAMQPHLRVICVQLYRV